ncbi:hypothetical protein MTR67_052637 [Solanum verrucosum]|uniref:Gag-pol polyprotein n=1 Tax=Solanum verrucosum TaxID=315347 RepID=A0AAF1A038_SOLVR|nr:hypothetical protein MTR67_052637 [Solanum verrucosum]
MALDQGSMFVAAYETKLHVLSRYATQLVTIEEERICLFIRGLNSELQVLSVHMTSTRRSFNEVTDFVKKVEGVRRDGQAKTLAKRAKNSGNFQGSYSRGSGKPMLAAKPIQFAMPASTGNYSGTPPHNLIQDSQGDAPSTGSRPSFDRTWYNYGEPRHMRKDCPHLRVLDSAQQQTRAVVPTRNSNNGRGRSQGGRGGNQRGCGGRGNGNVGRDTGDQGHQQDQGIHNAPKVQPQGEVTNPKFRDAIRMLSQVVTNQVGPQRENRQDVVDTSKIRQVSGLILIQNWILSQILGAGVEVESRSDLGSWVGCIDQIPSWMLGLKGGVGSRVGVGPR